MSLAIAMVRRDPELDEHEQRLFGCIVDPCEPDHLSVDLHRLPTFEPSRRDINQRLWAKVPPSHAVEPIQSLVSLPFLHQQNRFSRGGAVGVGVSL